MRGDRVSMLLLEKSERSRRRTLYSYRYDLPSAAPSWPKVDTCGPSVDRRRRLSHAAEQSSTARDAGCQTQSSRFVESSEGEV